MDNSLSQSIPDYIPVAFEPIYLSNNANQNIQLYSGKVELEQGSVRFTGSGIVELQWLPVPLLRFSLDLSFQGWQLPKLGSGTLHFLDKVQHAMVSVRGCKFAVGGDLVKVIGVVKHSEFGVGQKVRLIKFHLTNFWDYDGLPVREEGTDTTWLSRSVVTAGEWQITLDKIKESESVFKELKASGGYAITHVGVIEKSDGQEFDPKKAKDLFEALFRYLSFCRGAWVNPLLPVGLDGNGDRIWEKWSNRKVERWRTTQNWFVAHPEEGLTGGFPGFYDRWQDDTWKEVLELSNHWYVEANMSAGGIEGAIILAQAAFEMLGWTHLVTGRKVLGATGYEKLEAADKLRLLLTICGIKSAAPDSLSKLAATAGLLLNDGPQILVEIRNALVHANPSKRKKIKNLNHDLMFEAWNLSLWYLELILLSTFNYKGNYSSRVAKVPYVTAQVEKVPWL